jgi:hypothetical protein
MQQTTTQKSKLRSMLGSPSTKKKKHSFKIAYESPFITFPIGDGQTSEDTATLTGLLDTRVDVATWAGSDTTKQSQNSSHNL